MSSKLLIVHSADCGDRFAVVLVPTITSSCATEFSAMLKLVVREQLFAAFDEVKQSNWSSDIIATFPHQKSWSYDLSDDDAKKLFVHL